MIKQVQHQLDKMEELVKSLIQKDIEFMGIDQASEFLKLKKSTLYQLVFKRGIPFYKSTKKLLFKKSDLIGWVEESKVLTVNELELKLKTSVKN